MMDTDPANKASKATTASTNVGGGLDEAQKERGQNPEKQKQNTRWFHLEYLWIHPGSNRGPFTEGASTGQCEAKIIPLDHVPIGLVG